MLDGEELKLGTDPLKADTDDDGALDSKEIEIGTDPLVYQSSFNITLYGEATNDSATPSVEIELSGEQVDS